MPPQIAILLARLRMAAVLALVVVPVADWAWHFLPGGGPGWIVWAGLVAAFVVLRELFGPSRILGNHVVIDLGDGVYALLAHLRRRSVRVTAGQRVTVGQQIAECGNSGNSAWPHLHFQLMDHPSVLLAAGLPVCFLSADGPPAALPRNAQHLLADRASSTEPELLPPPLTAR